MNAPQFYETFLLGWEEALPRSPLKRLAGKTLKWKLQSDVGALIFAFATNPKLAGLAPHLPGEFRLGILWARKHDGQQKIHDVSLFQYTNGDEARAYADLQRRALEKFLRQPAKEPLRSIYLYAYDPDCLPRANVDEFSYYVDADDARAWGRWFAALVPAWIDRFVAHPESREDWCWRVLWSDARRPTPDQPAG